jgi:signal transduction histidine kinase
MDNLILNSEYWLKSDMEAKRIKAGTIKLSVDSGRVRVEDNGRGVIPELDQSLFEPFVTGKGRGKGRGLGLFIVRQLLDSEDSTITLLPDRNAFGRRYIFELDFSGVLDDRPN